MKNLFTRLFSSLKKSKKTGEVKEVFFQRYKYDTSKDLLGSGGFGKVYKAYDDILNKRVAIKISPVQEGRENLSLLSEVELAKKLPHHRNIAHYEDCFRFDSPMGKLDYGILQFYPAGNLSQLIKTKQLTFIQKEQIANGILKGIAHLHNNHIVHRDVKSSNVLISTSPDGEYIPKIADFGLSKEFNDNTKSHFSNSFVGGSFLYTAPEQLNGGEIRRNVDFWGMGVMLFELFTGQVPFYPNQNNGTESSRKEVVDQIENATLPSTINQIPKPWQTLIRSCLVVDSQKRLKNTQAAFLIINGEETIVVPPDGDDEKQLSTWFYPLIGGLVLLVTVLIYFNNETLFPNESVINEIEVGEEPLDDITETEEESLNDIEIPDPFVSQMKYIPNGSFKMGSDDNGRPDDEKPVHTVVISSFKMSKYEVTQKQWFNIMGENPSTFANCDSCPVETVSWDDTQEFIKKLNEQTGKKYRLPTEAEWEYAAQGGQNFKYAGSDNINSIAWYHNNSEEKTYPVGQKRANGFGLYDMTGNVWEWCSDWYDSGYYANSNVNNPRGANTGIHRVLRGGSWDFKEESCRTSDRSNRTPDSLNDSYGLRLAL